MANIYLTDKEWKALDYAMQYLAESVTSADEEYGNSLLEEFKCFENIRNKYESAKHRTRVIKLAKHLRNGGTFDDDN